MLNLFLTILRKVGRADKITQNRPQVRFGRLPKATYRLARATRDDSMPSIAGRV